METKDEKDQAYPPEYAHIQERMQQTQERLAQLDDWIQNTKDTKVSPELALHPPGYSRPRQPISPDQWIKTLEQQKADLKAETLAWTDQVLKEENPDNRRLIRDQVLEELYPNPFKEMDAAGKDTYRKQPKDLEKSQDLMDSMRRQDHSRPEKGREKEAPPEPERPSASLRYSLSLSYTSAVGKTDPSPNKSREKEIDRD